MNIGIVTTTRAEYGVLKFLIKKVDDDPETELNLIVTGTHLMKQYGNTIKYIEEDGFKIKKKVYVDIDTDSPSAISKTMGRYFDAFSNVFNDLDLDFLIVVGDRYELIPICYCAETVVEKTEEQPIYIMYQVKDAEDNILGDIYLEEENFMEYIIEKYQPTKGKKKCLM